MLPDWGYFIFFSVSATLYLKKINVTHGIYCEDSNSVFAFEFLVESLRMLIEFFYLTLYALMPLIHPPHAQMDRLTAIMPSEKNLIHNFVVVSGNAGITGIHLRGMKS